MQGAATGRLTRVSATLWRSTVGRKALVAVSGLALAGGVALELAGNLTVFSGPETADGYAAALRHAPAALWAVRLGLVVAALVHVAGVVSLTRADRAARPRYQGRARARSLTARGMRIGGALLLAFVVFHVLHLTFGYFHRSFQSGEVYANVVQGLQVPWVATVYLGGGPALGPHPLHRPSAPARAPGGGPDPPPPRH